MAKSGGKAGSFVELVITIVIVLALFPVIASSVAKITGDSENYSVGTIAVAGLLDLILMAGLIFYSWKKMT